MRDMPRTITQSDHPGDPPEMREAIEIPAIPASDFDRRLHEQVGDLTDAERDYVDLACRHGHTLTVIVDAIRERRDDD